MARNIFANTDVARTTLGFLEATPQLVAAVVACSVDVAAVTQVFVPGFSKSAMLHKRRLCDQARAEEVAQQLDNAAADRLAAMAERDEAVADRNAAEDACLIAEAEREAEEYERQGAQNECCEAEEARDLALAERDAVEAAFAKHVGNSRRLIGPTITLRRRLLVAEGERDRTNALNRRLYERLWAAEAERDAALERSRA